MLVPHHSLHFNIVDETDEYVVVDKPPFLLIHPTKPNGVPTLWKELRELLAFEIASGGQVSIVNRLDRETSGLVLVAKTSAAARRFGLLMQRQQVKKEYLAIVWGWPEWSAIFCRRSDGSTGQTSRIGDLAKQMIHPSGAPAQTEFLVERRFVRSMVTPSPLASRLPLSGQGEDEGEGQREFTEKIRRVAKKSSR